MKNETIQLVLRAAQVLFRPGDVVEVRVPKAGKLKTISGYFDNFHALAEAVAQLERAGHPAVYWTLNPVHRDLLSRAANRVKPYANTATSGEDIVCRLRLLIDFDPVRRADISSTEEEHEAALQLTEHVRTSLMAEGWPDALMADSGNGGHLVYAIDLPNTPESLGIVEGVLRTLAARFNTDKVKLDEKVGDANRIVKVWGTTARKGDSTEERPHRISRMLHVPEDLQAVPLEVLQRTAALAPKQQRPQQSPFRNNSVRAFVSGQRAEFSLVEFLTRHGIAYRKPVQDKSGWKYVLEHCPFNADHKAPDSAVWEYSDGYGFKCLHNSCNGNDWHAFREHFEGPRPVYTPRFTPQSATPAPLPSDAKPESDAEIPLAAADVEAAVDAAIEANDLPQAMRLIPEIVRVPEITQALIVSKLRVKFKRDFPSREFTRALKAEIEEAARRVKPVVYEEDLELEDAPDLIGDIPLTDSGNGERLILLSGKDIRFCSEFKRWLLWTGHPGKGWRWKVDDDAAHITQKVKDMARLLYKQAARVADPELRKAYQKHARKAEDQKAIANALLRAKSEPGISISAADLDKHRYLLNCLNGVVDVRSGELLPHDRSYLITKLCHFNYKPDSNPEKDCPRFLKLVRWAMGESPDDAGDYDRVTRMVGFLQKAFGYALTGDVSEKCAFIFYGSKGNNGKTTLLTVFKTLLAEYAAQLDINTLMTSKFTDNNVRADMARLHGARFVITSEVDDGQRLSERLMKYLTAGMGEITACRKFENPFEFHATHKIFMDCNYRPEIKGADEAIWGRLICVPFLQRIDKTDPTIVKELQRVINDTESEGVLAWAVRGCMRWREEGLELPAEVQSAVSEWRDADDPLKPFFEECCEIDLTDAECYVRCQDFTRTYQSWCKDNNEPQLKASRLTQRLLMKGIKLNRSRRIGMGGTQVRCWDGIKLRDDVTQNSVSPKYRSADEKEF